MKKKPADWEKTHEELAKLRMLPESAPAGGKADGQIEPEPKSIELLPDNSAPTE
jgi:hypothetical protein